MSTPFLEIPAFQALIPITSSIQHIGKQTIRDASPKALDAAILSPISRITHDPSTQQVIKEQFIIFNKNNRYYIEDRHSTNGTFLDGINLKLHPPQPLHEGSIIIIPIEQNGQLTQLKLIFHIDSSVKTPSRISPFESDPTLGKPKSIDLPFENRVFLSENKNKTGKFAHEAQYYDPTHQPTISPDEMVSPPSNALFYHSQMHDSTKSFIIIREKITLPSNAFDPQISQQYGLDLSMFHRLDQKQWVHIGVAYLILVFLAYRTYTNILLFSVWNTYGYEMISFFGKDIFINPIPAALIFGAVFLVHELSHVGIGKKEGFPSRFCLLKKGLWLSMIAALLGIPIALPGAAVSLGLDPDENVTSMGRIKIAGPLSNLIFGWTVLISGILLKILTVDQSPFLLDLFLMGAMYNYSLGLFNMIPTEFGSFALDGKFIFKWKKARYFLLLLGLIVGYLVGFLFLA